MSCELVQYKENPKIQCFAVIINNRMPHLHDDIEIIYVLKGSITVERKDKVDTLRAQDIFIFERNVVHALRKTNEENLLLAIQFNVGNMTEISPEFLKIRLKRHRFTPSDGVRYAAIKDAFYQMLDSYAHQADAWMPLKRMQLICGLCILISEALEHVILSDAVLAREEKNSLRLIQMLDFIMENHANEISLKDVAAHFGLSASHLSRIFKENMGISFGRYLSRTRVRHAERMLVATDRSLLDICMSCGFSDPQSLNRAFFEEYGCRLSEYRHTMRNTKYFFGTADSDREDIIIDVENLRDALG